MNVGWWLVRGWKWGGGKSLVTRWRGWQSSRQVSQCTVCNDNGDYIQKHTSAGKRERSLVHKELENIGTTVASVTRSHQTSFHPWSTATVGHYGHRDCSQKTHTLPVARRRSERSFIQEPSECIGSVSAYTTTSIHIFHIDRAHLGPCSTGLSSATPSEASEVDLCHHISPTTSSYSRTPNVTHQISPSHSMINSVDLTQYSSHLAQYQSCMQPPDSHTSVQPQGFSIRASSHPAKPPVHPTQPPCHPTQPPSHYTQSSSHRTQSPGHPVQPPGHPVQPPGHPNQLPGHPSQPPGIPKPLSIASKTTVAQKIVNACPVTLRAYLQLMRLHQPIGSWLLFWPCGWSLALSAPAGCFPDPTLLVLFGAGAVIMRGAGCTINDMWDRDIDGKVSRTASRPLADGTLTLWDATALLAVQLGLGCFILLQLNFTSIILGASSLGLVMVYPLMKRITWFPQVVLGLTFNWGALLGWTAVTSTIAAPPFFLYASGLAWTLIYDTIYAHQDKDDDAQLGIKSTALKFGSRTQPILGVIGAGMVSSLLAVGAYTDLAWPYYVALVAISTHISRQIWTLNIDDPSDCGHKFRSNRHVGLMIFLGIVGGMVLKGDQT